MRQLRSRALALGVFALLIGAGSASAQSTNNVTPLSEAQSLACLKRPEGKPDFPDLPNFDRSERWMRVLLRFSAPDAAPQVEVLGNTMREDQVDVVQRYVKRYRLPCLKASDGKVGVVQEFRFNNSGLDPLPMPPERPLAVACVVQPPDGVNLTQTIDRRRTEHVVLTMAFEASPSRGAGKPQIKVLYADASPSVLEAITDWAARTRVPCMTGETDETQGLVVLRQHFIVRPSDERAYTINDGRLSLVRFLGMTRDLDSLKANFDFDTMSCPFKVNYTIYGPRLPNEVDAGHPLDPNRLAFLKWLEARDLNLKSEKMANDLFGQVLQIDVPCGRLKLGDETTAATSP